MKTASIDRHNPVTHIRGEEDRNEHQRILATLKTSPFFYDLTPEEFNRIARKMRLHSLQSESIVIREGEKGHSLFIVTKGVLRVTIQHPATEKNILLDKLSKGSLFGEVSLLTGRTRSATITALTDSELFEIPGEIFKEIAMQYPAVRRFLVNLCRRHEKQTYEILRGLNIERRVFFRKNHSGTITFQEEGASETIKVITIGKGELINISEGGAAFYVHKKELAGLGRKTVGKRYKIQIKTAAVPDSLKAVGKVVSCERAIDRGKLSDFYVMRIKFCALDPGNIERLKLLSEDDVK